MHGSIPHARDFHLFQEPREFQHPSQSELENAAQSIIDDQRYRRDRYGLMQFIQEVMVPRLLASRDAGTSDWLLEWTEIVERAAMEMAENWSTEEWATYRGEG